MLLLLGNKLSPCTGESGVVYPWCFGLSSLYSSIFSLQEYLKLGYVDRIYHRYIKGIFS